MRSLTLLTLVLVLAETAAFVPSTFVSKSTIPLYASKGFNPNPKKKIVKSEGQTKRDTESSKYDEIATGGGQQYSVHVRQFGGEDVSWLPCGSVAVPRGAQVADAIFANEENLKKSIVRTMPKLGGYEDEFEYGYNLKMYPDDPVEVAMKGSIKKQGPSVGNWISNVLSPIDAKNVPKPDAKE